MVEFYKSLKVWLNTLTEMLYLFMCVHVSLFAAFMLNRCNISAISNRLMWVVLCSWHYGTSHVCHWRVLCPPRRAIPFKALKGCAKWCRQRKYVSVSFYYFWSLVMILFSKTKQKSIFWFIIFFYWLVSLSDFFFFWQVYFTVQCYRAHSKERFLNDLRKVRDTYKGEELKQVWLF